MFKTSSRWVAETAWDPSEIEEDEDTNTIFNPTTRQAALHVDTLEGGSFLRVPVCTCYKNDIDSVIVGTHQIGGTVLHGAVGRYQAARWMCYLRFDEDTKSPYFRLPVSSVSVEGIIASK